MPTRKNNSRRMKKFSNKRKMNKRSNKKSRNKNQKKSIKRRNMRGGLWSRQLTPTVTVSLGDKTITSKSDYYKNFNLLNQSSLKDKHKNIFEALVHFHNENASKLEKLEDKYSYFICTYGAGWGYSRMIIMPLRKAGSKMLGHTTCDPKKLDIVEQFVGTILKEVKEVEEVEEVVWNVIIVKVLDKLGLTDQIFGKKKKDDELKDYFKDTYTQEVNDSQEDNDLNEIRLNEIRLKITFVNTVLKFYFSEEGTLLRTDDEVE